MQVLVHRKNLKKYGPRLFIVVIALMAVAASCQGSDSSQDPETPSVNENAGTEGLGDRYVGTFGNGGYDVAHYDLNLTWDQAESQLDGVTTIEAAATQELEQFNLDLHSLEAHRVEVDGVEAPFSQEDPELVVTPAEPLAAGSDFVVRVTYSGEPKTVDDPGVSTPIPSGWQIKQDYIYVAGEPVSASTFYPVNEHPSDKATYTYEITASSDQTVAVSGTLLAKEEKGDLTTWSFEQPHPQANYLTTIVIGGFTVVDDGITKSGVPIRNVIDDDLIESSSVFAQQKEMLEFFETTFGPYPFDNYGSALVEDSFGGALETQTLSIFGSDMVELGPYTQRIVAHELAHQWFGNHVSIKKWEDLWLNEGFASYAEALWLEKSDPSFSWDQWVAENNSFTVGVNATVHRPDEGNLFGVQVYLRGALTLHALRQEVGDEAFFTILKTWNSKYGGANATTEDFEELAEESSGKKLGSFFDAWLRTEEPPNN